MCFKKYSRHISRNIAFAENQEIKMLRFALFTLQVFKHTHRLVYEVMKWGFFSQHDLYA